MRLLLVALLAATVSGAGAVSYVALDPAEVRARALAHAIDGVRHSTDRAALLRSGERLLDFEEPEALLALLEHPMATRSGDVFDREWAVVVRWGVELHAAERARDARIRARLEALAHDATTPEQVRAEACYLIEELETPRFAVEPEGFERLKTVTVEPESRTLAEAAKPILEASPLPIDLASFAGATACFHAHDRPWRALIRFAQQLESRRTGIFAEIEVEGGAVQLIPRTASPVWGASAPREGWLEIPDPTDAVEAWDFRLRLDGDVARCVLPFGPDAEKKLRAVARSLGLTASEKATRTLVASR
ncbi:MAG TPA: hypothetical protein VFF73_12535 [Planctomycetota bacterium]|nr:hypothetical protein [Planctomycetota bacterium]